MAGGTGVTVGLCLVVLASGCLGGASGGKSFQPLAAPVWQAGYSWTYDLTQSTSASGPSGPLDGGETDSDLGRVELTVFNTSQPMDGESVYYLRSSQEFDHPFLRGSVLALSQSDLAQVGYGSDVYSVAVPASAEEDVARPVPCQATGPIRPIPAEQRFPWFLFPLEQGRKWSGVWGPEQDFGLAYTSEIQGMRSVQVPAGTFDAVYVTTDLQGPPADPRTGEADGFSLRVRVETWYAPQAQFIVKNTVRASGTFPLGEDGAPSRFEYASTMNLASFALTAGPESPAPPLEPGSDRPVAYRPLQIVSETEFPVNVADGPVLATFGLIESDAGPMTSEVALAPRVAAEAPIDHETSQVRWSLRSDTGRDFVESVGDTFQHEFARGGGYFLSAEVVPLGCGGAWYGSAGASLSAYWQKSFQFTPYAGLAEAYHVSGFPVEVGALQGIFNWRASPAAGYPIDSGQPRIVDPTGRSFPIGAPGSAGSAEWTSWYPWGDWRLEWEPEGLATVGDEIELTLRLDYGSPGYHCIDYC